jgi:hypothetical protein
LIDLSLRLIYINFAVVFGLKIPANKEAVDNEVGDIPGYVDKPSYVYKNKNGDSYGFDFGLTYK